MIRITERGTARDRMRQERQRGRERAEAKPKARVSAAPASAQAARRHRPRPRRRTPRDHLHPTAVRPSSAATSARSSASGEKAQATRRHHPRRLGQHHQRRRAAIAPLVNAGKATCCRCHEPIHAGEEWHLDHNDARDGYLGVCHATCNLRDGANKTNGKTAPVRSQEALPVVTTLVRRPAHRNHQLRRRTQPRDLRRQRRMAAAG